MNPQAQHVLDFWFGAAGSSSHGQLRAEWFRKDDSFDAEIARRFGPQVEAALAGSLRDWADEPADALARLIVLDQFTRNVFRDTPRAFAGDALALAGAQTMQASGQYARLTPLQRVFAIMPFEHSEDLAMQDQSVRLFSALVAETPALGEYLDYARRHYAVIARFGRFPHRNALLGRPGTDEESAFLAQPGSRF